MTFLENRVLNYGYKSAKAIHDTEDTKLTAYGLDGMGSFPGTTLDFCHHMHTASASGKHFPGGKG